METTRIDRKSDIKTLELPNRASSDLDHSQEVRYLWKHADRPTIYERNRKGTDMIHKIIHTCKKCQVAKIYFDNERRALSGKCIPIEVDTDIPHRCTVSSLFPCKYCDETIYLDQWVKSKNDRLIPLSFNTNAPHNCPKRPARSFFKNRGTFT